MKANIYPTGSANKLTPTPSRRAKKQQEDSGIIRIMRSEELLKNVDQE